MKKHEHATENNPESKPGSKPDAKDDLKSLPMPEVEKRLGSSPDGLSQADAQKRLTQYGPNEIKEKKTNPFLKFLTYFWGPIPFHPGLDRQLGLQGGDGVARLVFFPESDHGVGHEQKENDEEVGPVPGERR